MTQIACDGGRVSRVPAAPPTPECKARALRRLSRIATTYMEAVAARNATEAEVTELEIEAEIAERWCRAYGAVTGEIEAAYRAGLATAK